MPYTVKRKHNDQGFSLTEILIVVVILGITALVVVPSLHSTDEKVLEVASNDVVQAIRFAQSEAERTGQPHGVNLELINKRLRVYWWNVNASPPDTYTVYNPIDKKLYDMRFESELLPARLSSVSFQYSGAVASTYLSFAGTTGTPQLTDGTNTRMLESAVIKLNYRTYEHIITVAPFTGRVTVK